MEAKKGAINADLLEGFNRRDKESFGRVYELLYGEMCLFCSRAFQNIDGDVEDTVHDVFVKLWLDKQITFKGIAQLKSYLHISLNSRFINQHKRNNKRDAIKKILQQDKSWQVAAIETEVVSFVSVALKLLPEQCAKSFKLFLEGYNINEIAQILDKPVTTIHSQKQRAITILKSKISKNGLSIILQLIN